MFFYEAWHGAPCIPEIKSFKVISVRSARRLSLGLLPCTMAAFISMALLRACSMERSG